MAIYLRMDLDPVRESIDSSTEALLAAAEIILLKHAKGKKNDYQLS